MPKKSKLQSISSKPGDPGKRRVEPEQYYCSRCDKGFKKQAGNFLTTKSPIFKANNGYLPVCKQCVEEMFEHYKAALGNEKAAIRRICMKFDIYWSEAAYNMIYKGNTTNSRVESYVSRINLKQFAGKTFDTTLDEESAAGIFGEDAVPAIEFKYDFDEDADFEAEEQPIPTPESVVTPEMRDFWGAGLAPSFYVELTKRYEYWSGGDDSTMDLAERAIIKQICMLEVTINKDSAQGKSIEKHINALNNLLGSANLKPVQKKDNGIDNAADNTPFGMWIRKIENTEPIPEPDPEFKDVDGIVRYIHIWFFGHLCKMVGIKNSYSRMYEEEMARLRVEKPEYEEEDDDSFFEDLFNKTRNDEPLGG